MLNANELTHEVIGSAIEVHKALGPGLLESAYVECMCYELSQRGIAFRREVGLPVVYKGCKLDCGYRIDVVVEDTVAVEAKSTDALHPIHEAQLLTYLRLGGWPVGLLINLNVPVLKNGIRRRVLNLSDEVLCASASLR